jgi:hypothetical protein
MDGACRTHERNGIAHGILVGGRGNSIKTNCRKEMTLVAVNALRLKLPVQQPGLIITGPHFPLGFALI